MTSKVEICNLALGKLGGDPISSLDNPQTSNESILALFYPIVLKKMLEERDWSFLIVRKIFDTPLASPPDWGYSYQHLLPSDVERVIDVRQNDRENQASNFEWRIESNSIVCNEKKIFVRYIKSSGDESRYSSNFVMALSIELAHQICIKVTGNRGLKGDLQNEAKAALYDAATSDGMQGSNEEKYSGSLIEARYTLSNIYSGGGS